MPQSAQESFELALRHLDKVLLAWDDPTDWADLATYGFYCLEACVVAVALYLGRQRPRQHHQKVREARNIAREQGLPDVADLLVDLNSMRKHEAYGDIEPPEGLDPQDVAGEIEDYVEAVQRLLSR